MFFYFASFVLCNLPSKLNLYEFNKTQYHTFRDCLEKNHFLITLATNHSNSETFQFYKNLFIDICNDISSYFNENIDITFSILTDHITDNKNDAIILIYLPGISEAEIEIYPRMSVAFNSNKILNKCLTLAINLRRLEKSQKSPEVARIKKELLGISKMLKILPSDDSKRQDLLNDYQSLTEELMQFTSENKQKSKKLKLQLQLYPDGSSESHKIEKKIKKIKKQEKKLEKKKIKTELSPKKLQRKAQKNMINTLRKAVHDSYMNIFKSAYGTAYKYAKAGVAKIWKSKKQTDL